MSDISCRDINERTCRGGLNEYYDEDQDDLTFKNKEMCEAENRFTDYFYRIYFLQLFSTNMIWV